MTGSHLPEWTAGSSLSWRDRRFLLVLAIPACGISFAYTLVTTYVPVLLNELSGPAVIGLLIGAEGLLGLVVPVLLGTWSDRLRTRWGSRLPLVFTGSALVAAALLLIPVGAGSLIAITATLMAFFVAYFVYYAPYFAMFPDFVPRSARGRSQGFLGALRAIGMLAALGSGGLLLSLWLPLPFIIAAAGVLAVTAMLYLGIRQHVGNRGTNDGKPKPASSLRLLRENPRIRLWAIGNACWEGALAALRTFVVLYFTVGLGVSLANTSAALTAVGVVAILTAPVAGKLADRYGPVRVMSAAVLVFAAGTVIPLLTTNLIFLIAVVPVAFAAVVLLTLPYSVLMGFITDTAAHGAAAGLHGMSRGVGVLAGPILAGIAITSTESIPVLTFQDTNGYSAAFAITGALLLASVPALRRMRSMTARAPSTPA